VSLKEKPAGTRRFMTGYVRALAEKRHEGTALWSQRHEATGETAMMRGTIDVTRAIAGRRLRMQPRPSC